MAVNGIGASRLIRRGALSRSADEAADARRRALVPMHQGSFGNSHGPYARRPSAAFLTQLIATRQGEPQTREKRRATSAVAAQAYAAAARLDGRSPGKN